MFGFGNVGRFFAETISQKREILADRYGLEIVLTCVTDTTGAAVSAQGLDPGVLLDAKRSDGGAAYCPQYGQPGIDPRSALANARADIVVEATPTNMTTGEPGLSNIKLALSSGMHVATASKGALVLAYSELMQLAKERGLALKFAAAVASPLPTIELADFALQGCEIKSIDAILNATSNCILRSMETGAGTFEEALKDAQRRGVAEANPRLDVEGWDTSGKLVILTNALMGKVSLNEVERRGVDTVTPEMVKEARAEGKSIKLLGTARRVNGHLELRVVPVAVPPEHPLFAVNGIQKGISIDTDLAGRLTVIDGGAGPLATAQCVLRDVVNIARFHMR